MASLKTTGSKENNNLSKRKHVFDSEKKNQKKRAGKAAATFKLFPRTHLYYKINVCQYVYCQELVSRTENLSRYPWCDFKNGNGSNSSSLLFVRRFIPILLFLLELWNFWCFNTNVYVFLALLLCLKGKNKMSIGNLDAFHLQMLHFVSCYIEISEFVWNILFNIFHPLRVFIFYIGESI